jgi:hypothetical protein
MAWTLDSHIQTTRVPFLTLPHSLEWSVSVSLERLIDLRTAARPWDAVGEDDQQKWKSRRLTRARLRRFPSHVNSDTKPRSCTPGIRIVEHIALTWMLDLDCACATK